MESFPAYRASVQLKRVLLPVIMAAGTFGNVAVVVIQRRLPPSQKSSMSVYFTALAVSDTTALWTGWFEILEAFGVTLSVEYHVQRDYSDVVVDALCRIRVWTSLTFGTVSAWILVSMTIHRALSIVWPHRARTFLAQSSAKKVVVFIVSLFALSNAHTLYGHSLKPADDGQTEVCYYSFVGERYGEFFNRVWQRVNVVVAVLLPFLCLLVTNTVLVRRVGRSLREARETLAEGRHSHQLAASRDRKLSSMTVTLVTTSAAFLLLTVPLSVSVILENALVSDDDAVRDDVRLRAANALSVSACVALWYTNLAANFYLYCLTGARYRAEFLRLFLSFCVPP